LSFVSGHLRLLKRQFRFKNLQPTRVLSQLKATLFIKIVHAILFCLNYF